MASSLQRLERRASVSSISPGRDLKDDNHRSKVAYMLILTLIPLASGSLNKLISQHGHLQAQQKRENSVFLSFLLLLIYDSLSSVCLLLPYPFVSLSLPLLSHLPTPYLAMQQKSSPLLRTVEFHTAVILEKTACLDLSTINTHLVMAYKVLFQQNLKISSIKIQQIL